MGAMYLFQTGDEKMQGLYVMKLVRSFCRSSSGEDSGVLFFSKLFRFYLLIGT